MSLKAKIEAVIYASEEPVTLAQLIGLLGQEAQAELDRADAAQGSLSLNETEAELEAAAELDASLSEAAEPATEASAAESSSGAKSEFDADAAADQPNVSEDAATSAEPIEAGLKATDDSAADTAPNADPEAAVDAGPEALVEAVDASSVESAEPDPAVLARAERARAARLRIYFRSLLDALITEYATSDRGLEVREVAGGFRFATKPEYHDAVRGFVRSLKPPLKLSLQALETLAVVAYKQPVTAPEVSEIRGVDSGGVLGSLMARKLVTTAGRKQVIGRPILYKTTKEFLLKFGLKDIGELPSIEEFERMAGQMVEQEEIPMSEGGTAEETEERDPNAGVREESSADDVVAANEDAERQAYAPHEEGMRAAADDLAGAPADKASVDGRISSLPPNYAEADAEDDPSAREAEIQSEQGS